MCEPSDSESSGDCQLVKDSEGEVEEGEGGGGVEEGEGDGGVEEQDSVDCLLLSSEEDIYFESSDEAVKEEVVTEEASNEEVVPEEAMQEEIKEIAVAEEEAEDKSRTLQPTMSQEGNYVGQLFELVRKVVGPAAEPAFTFIFPFSKGISTVEVTAAGRSAAGSGPGKKQARQVAARRLLEKLQEEPKVKGITLKEVSAERGETVSEKSSTVEAVMKESVMGEELEGKVKEGGGLQSDSKEEVKSVRENDDLVVRADVIEGIRVPHDLKTEQQYVKSLMAEIAKLREKNIALVDVVDSVRKEVVDLKDDKDKEKNKYKGQIGRLLGITEPMRIQLIDQILTKG